MKNFYQNLFLGIFGLLFSVFSLAQDYSSGIFILNEGGAGANNSSLSFLNSEGELENNAFSNVNSINLGDTAQGIGFHDGKIYITVNISNTVVIADQTTLEHIATISDEIENPRYISFSNGKGFVTCWGDPMDTTASYVAVIDLENHEIISTIPVTEGPEQILEKDGKLYVAHMGGYGHGNTVSVIDAETYEVTSINVGDVPNSMVLLDDELFVLCGGTPSWTGSPTEGSFYKINLENNESTLILEFPEGETPAYLSYENDNFYYTIEADIYKLAVDATTLPENHFIETPITGWGGAYGLDIFDDVIYVADPSGFIDLGFVYTYDANTGNLIETYAVGMNPNGFYRNQIEEVLNTIDVSLTQFSVYPNPTSDIFYINSELISKVEIFDVSGRLVKTTQNVAQGINVRELNKGVYILRIHSENEISTQRLIVK